MHMHELKERGRGRDQTQIPPPRPPLLLHVDPLPLPPLLPADQLSQEQLLSLADSSLLKMKKYYDKKLQPQAGRDPDEEDDELGRRQGSTTQGGQGQRTLFVPLDSHPPPGRTPWLRAPKSSSSSSSDGGRGGAPQARSARAVGHRDSRGRVREGGAREEGPREEGARPRQYEGGAREEGAHPRQPQQQGQSGTAAKFKLAGSSRASSSVEAVIQEVVRKTPPGPLTREALREDWGTVAGAIHRVEVEDYGAGGGG